jgi:hypothetical protein
MTSHAAAILPQVITEVNPAQHTEVHEQLRHPLQQPPTAPTEPQSIEPHQHHPVQPQHATTNFTIPMGAPGLVPITQQVTPRNNYTIDTPALL